MRRWRSRAAGVGLLIMTVGGGCQAELPELESAGAVLYRTRCRGCHRLYHPGTMTADMWQFQIERMPAIQFGQEHDVGCDT